MMLSKNVSSGKKGEWTDSISPQKKPANVRNYIKKGDSLMQRK